MHRVLTVLAIAAGLAVTTGEALAHGFKLVALVPLSGASAETGRHWLDGFLLATRERDAHPEQHSDGHLGGLDVYVLPLDSNRGLDDAVSALKTLVETEQPEILAGPAPAALLDQIRPWLADRPTILIEPSDDAPSDWQTMNGGSFRQAFQTDYGYGPPQAASLGYGVARRVDRVVRDAAGDFSDKAALQSALGRSQSP